MIGRAQRGEAVLKTFDAAAFGDARVRAAPAAAGDDHSDEGHVYRRALSGRSGASGDGRHGNGRGLKRHRGSAVAQQRCGGLQPVGGIGAVVRMFRRFDVVEEASIDGGASCRGDRCEQARGRPPDRRLEMRRASTATNDREPHRRGSAEPVRGRRIDRAADVRRRCRPSRAASARLSSPRKLPGMEVAVHQRVGYAAALDALRSGAADLQRTPTAPQRRRWRVRATCVAEPSAMSRVTAAPRQSGRPSASSESSRPTHVSCRRTSSDTMSIN